MVKTLQITPQEIQAALRTSIQHLISAEMLHHNLTKEQAQSRVASQLQNIIHEECQSTLYRRDQLQALVVLLNERNDTTKAQAVQQTVELLNNVFKDNSHDTNHRR